jgi:hypothetical protein
MGLFSHRIDSTQIGGEYLQDDRKRHAQQDKRNQNLDQRKAAFYRPFH